MLSGSNLEEAQFRFSNLSGADLTNATMDGVDLQSAIMVDTDISGATLSDCLVRGVSAWGLKLDGTTQSRLVISQFNESTVMVDNLELAQLIHLLRHSKKARDVIDTVSTKVVLILGRFTK